MGQVRDLTNRRFGRLVVVKRDSIDKHGKMKWLCLCDCGTEVIVRGNELVKKDTSSCGCFRRDNIRKVHCISHPIGFTRFFLRIDAVQQAEFTLPKYTCHCLNCGNIYICNHKQFMRRTSCGCRAEDPHRNRKENIELIINRKWNSYRTNARKDGREFAIDFTLFYQLCTTSCTYCGGVSTVQVHGKRWRGTAQVNGIDRIDSTKGYVVGNITSCCSDCNRLKMEHSEEHWVVLLRNILVYRGGIHTDEMELEFLE